MEGKKKTLQSISFEDELRNKIIKIAENERRSISSTVVVLCEEAIKNRESNTDKKQK